MKLISLHNSLVGGIFVGLCVLCVPFVARANITGFVEGVVTLTPSSFIEGDEVEISISFQNIETKALTGEIHFYNNDEILAVRELALEAGQTGEFVMLWTATLGEHTLYAKAEKLRLEGSQVTILGPKTDERIIKVGFSKSNIAEQLRERGGVGAVLAGVLDAGLNFFNPIIQSINEWRMSRVPDFEARQEAVQVKQDIEDTKNKGLLALYGGLLWVGIFIFASIVVFWILFCVLFVFLLIRLFRILQKIIRGNHDQP